MVAGYGVFVTQKPIRNPIVRIVWELLRIFATLGAFVAPVGVIGGLLGLFGQGAIYVQLGTVAVLGIVSAMAIVANWRLNRAIYVEVMALLLGLAFAAWFVTYSPNSPMP
jgi:hypothetical protein